MSRYLRTVILLRHVRTTSRSVGRVVELAVACCRTRATCVADVGSLMVALGTLAENKVSTWTSSESPENAWTFLGLLLRGAVLAILVAKQSILSGKTTCLEVGPCRSLEREQEDAQTRDSSVEALQQELGRNNSSAFVV